MTFASHKFYGPKGVGGLLQKFKLAKVFEGAGQENNRRPGTENVMLISGMARALEVCGIKMQDDMENSALNIQTIFNIINDSKLDFVVNGIIKNLL